MMKISNMPIIADRSPLYALLIWACFFVLFSAVDSWAECQPTGFGTRNMVQPSGYTSQSGLNPITCSTCSIYLEGGCPSGTSVSYCNTARTRCQLCKELQENPSQGSCPDTYSAWGAAYGYNSIFTNPIELCGTSQSSCNNNGTGCVYQSVCNGQCSADSLACVNGGGTWIYTGRSECNGMECQQCRPDTTITEITCTYSASRGQYLNKVHRFGVRDCMPFDSEYEYYSASCDSSKNDSTLQCLGSFDGVHVQVRNPATGKIVTCNADGSCSAAISKILSGECENPFPQSSSGAESSSSTPESSSSSEDGSSSSEDGPPNSSGSNDWEQWMKDSLGHIDANIEWSHTFISGIYDGVNELSGTAHEINTNTRNTAESVAEVDNKLSTTNSLLNDIKNKEWDPTINVNNNTDVSGIQSRQDQTRDTLHNTNQILENIRGLLDSSNARAGRLESSVGSIDAALSDTSGGSYDTSGSGRVLDSLGALLDSSLYSYPCDTTGGKRCSTAYIGGGAIEAQAGQLRIAAGALSDSLNGGVVNDSLTAWSNKLVNNGVLSGNGSNNCPAAFQRTYQIPLGNGITYPFGPFSKIVCYEFLGGITFWALARIVLRALVAITCMWWLYHSVTGTNGGNDDED